MVMLSVSGIILGAGKSERFGSDKLLHTLRGRMLLSYVVESAKASKLSELIVVLSPSREEIIAVEGIKKVINRTPEMGMGYSISLGVAAVSGNSSGVLILPADMPFIGSALIDRYISLASEYPGRIITGKHGETIMVPTFFPRKFFPDLLILTGDRGARSLVMSESEVVKIDLTDKEAMDVDYPADLEYFND